MQGSHGSKIPKKNARIQCGKYLIRTIKEDDASDRWASWMSDPEAMYLLNSPARTWTKNDVGKYIRRFDQRSRLLLGVFEKQSGTHIGILTVEIDAAGQFLVNYIVGEPDYRNQGVTNDITVPFRDYFFETLGLNAMMATALSRNHIIIHYLYKTGFKLDQTLKHHVKSNSDDTMLDLCLFSLSKDAWRAWKKANLPEN
jgi:RimJ/RimL family protein N-acetyltransferase